MINIEKQLILTGARQTLYTIRKPASVLFLCFFSNHYDWLSSLGGNEIYKTWGNLKIVLHRTLLQVREKIKIRISYLLFRPDHCQKKSHFIANLFANFIQTQNFVCTGSIAKHAIQESVTTPRYINSLTCQSIIFNISSAQMEN